MKTKLLRLNKPCDEKWENMTPNERGSFCDSCSKNVIDFTRLSQLEISEIMKKSDGNICARVTSTQLRTPLFNLEPERKSFRFPYPKVAAGLMLASSLTVGHPVNAETTDVKTEFVVIDKLDLKTESKNEEDNLDKSESNIFTLFRGKIVSEEDGVPIENAKITLFTINKIISTHSTEDGTFALEIPSNLIDNNNVIRVSYDAVKQNNRSIKVYETQDYILSKKDLGDVHNFFAESTLLFFGQVGVDMVIDKPIVIYNGEKLDYDEFINAQMGVKNSCNLENKDYYYFEMEASVAIYGEEAQFGLYILTEKPVK